MMCVEVHLARGGAADAVVIVLAVADVASSFLLVLGGGGLILPRDQRGILQFFLLACVCVHLLNYHLSRRRNGEAKRSHILHVASLLRPFLLRANTDFLKCVVVRVVCFYHDG